MTVAAPATTRRVVTKQLSVASVLAVAIGVAWTAGAQPAPNTRDLEEYRLKAAFVARFAEFVEWPSTAGPDRASFNVCAAAPATFVTALRELTAGARAAGRPLAVHQITNDDEVDTCHVLFVAASSPVPVSAIMRRAESKPILTVGEEAGFLERGGMINLSLVDRRVRFEIDNAAAQRAGLRLSSQLLRLALNVRGGPS